MITWSYSRCRVPPTLLLYLLKMIPLFMSTISSHSQQVVSFLTRSNWKKYGWLTQTIKLEFTIGTKPKQF